MKVLMVDPNKAPYETEIDSGLHAMQDVVGGSIEAFYPYDDPVVFVCNEEGKLDGLPLNRAIYTEDGRMADIIAGTFFIAGLGEDDFTDLPADLMEKFKEQFKYPEKFVRLAGEIVAVKQPLPADAQEKPLKAPPTSDREL